MHFRDVIIAFVSFVCCGNKLAKMPVVFADDGSFCFRSAGPFRMRGIRAAMMMMMVAFVVMVVRSLVACVLFMRYGKVAVFCFACVKWMALIRF